MPIFDFEDKIMVYSLILLGCFFIEYILVLEVTKSLFGYPYIKNSHNAHYDGTWFYILAVAGHLINKFDI